MGAYSPPPSSPRRCRRGDGRIVRPTLAEMAARGAPFRGVLFAG
jgi:phosphoribosylamine---glycine ligase